MAKIKVVIYTAGWDTGGQGYRLKTGIERYFGDEFEVRSIHHAESYFHYPSDLQYRAREATELFAKADIIHMRNGIDDLERLRPEALEGKVPLVSHYHGTKFREDHAALSAKDRAAKAIQLVSTVDLLDLEPHLIWLPSPMDVYALREIRETALIDLEAPIRIAHAPTDRKVKSTKAVMGAVDYLTKHVGLPLELDLIEKASWETVLLRKAHANMYVDQLNLGYGNNALEAWSMGLPVIAGASPTILERMRREFGYVPFYEATERDLADKIAEMATDVRLRLQWGHLGFEHTLAHHDEQKVATRLAAVYHAAIEMRSYAHAE